MRSLNVLLAVLVSLILGLGVLEGGLRLLPGFSEQPTLNQHDERLGWSKIPGNTIERRVAGSSITFAINENGLRDDPGVGPGKEPGTFRVVMLGDSFVLGYTVNREDLFVDQLEGWWRAEERRIDVVNTGTEGWSTDQEVLWFLENGKAYEPDLVLLFPYENDIYWNAQSAYGDKKKPRIRPDGGFDDKKLPAPPKKGKAMSFATVDFLKGTSTWLRSMLNGSSAPMQPEFGVLLNEPPPEYDTWVAHTEGALKALRDGCELLGTRLLICPIPSKSAIDADEREFFQDWDKGLNGLAPELWSPDRPVNLFLELATKLGIEALDPRTALVAASKDGRLYFEGEIEWHLNARGNRAFATWLHDEFDRRELLPPEHQARSEGTIPAPHGGGFPTFLYVFAALWAVLGTVFVVNYPKEPKGVSFLGVGGMLTLVFTMILGGGALMRQLPPSWGLPIGIGVVVLILGFVAWKLGRRLGTIIELLRAFTLRGHWYLMPLVVVLLTIGSLLVVAASSPLIAPFIYTLF
jgi:hypothetical protein